jgi:signal transduction histidine kinase
MTLGRWNLIIALLLALPAALLAYYAAGWIEMRDRRALLERVAQAQLNDVTRDACQADPGWFLAGPRTGRPSLAERQVPDADVMLPRPRADEMPFEFFAYDEEFQPKSVAGPRFPEDLRRVMRTSPPQRVASGSYRSGEGPGLQTAILTNWTPGPCAVLLFRQPPPPGRFWTNVMFFGGLYALAFLVALAAVAPTTMRIRRLAREAKASARSSYSDMVTVSGSDEISSLGAVFNDTATDIRQRAVDARDREEALRRYVETTTEDIVPPLATLSARLATLSGSEGPAAAKESHRLMMLVQNLAAVTRLRAVTQDAPREAVDLAAVVASVVETRRTLARVAGVTLDASRATTPVTVQADRALIEQAVANLVDNAIVYNRAGGAVAIELASYDHGRRFRLVVSDNGPGVDDETLAGLTANKRFRGDEARSRRPGGRGLGLALTREIADRFGMQLDLRQPVGGGFEAEISTRQAV